MLLILRGMRKRGPELLGHSLHNNRSIPRVDGFVVSSFSASPDAHFLFIVCGKY